MKRILVAVDGSDCSLRAVEYCGLQFSGMKDLSIVLLHVLPYMPPSIWDIGHLLNEDEKAAQRALAEKWIDNQRRVAKPIFDSAIAILEGAAFDPEQMQTKLISDSTDVAASILEEARNGQYLTLVLGRCGSSGVRDLFLGSTTGRIINRGAGLAICVVE